MTKPVNEKNIIESYFLESKTWKEGYKAFNFLFGRPLGWLYCVLENGDKLIRLDRKSNCVSYRNKEKEWRGCEKFLKTGAKALLANIKKTDDVRFLRRPNKNYCAIWPLVYIGQVKGAVMLCSFEKKEEWGRLCPAFQQFIAAELNLAFKTYELHNFYETVHPRALALSTIHSVHRLMSSSLRMDQLLPRLARLSAQVLKAKSCSVFLIDRQKKFLEPRFKLGGVRKRQMRLALGRGLEGRVASEGTSYRGRNCLSVPLVGEDVVGVITLKDKKLDGALVLRQFCF